MKTYSLSCEDPECNTGHSALDREAAILHGLPNVNAANRDDAEKHARSETSKRLATQQRVGDVRLVYAIDPGPVQSALVVLRENDMRFAMQEHLTLTNCYMLDKLRRVPPSAMLVIEQIQSMGMAVGQEVFGTVFESGRFFEAWPNPNRYMLPRRPIKLHLCGNMQAKDSNVRQALLDKFGGANAIGRKATPGPLYGLKGHEFAALAVAVTWLETQPISSGMTA